MEHDINALLYEPRLAEIFSEDIIFALRGLLVERAGRELPKPTCTRHAGIWRVSSARRRCISGGFSYICVLLGCRRRGNAKGGRESSCLSISPTNTRPNSLSGGPRPISDIEDRTISGIMFTTL